MKPQFSYQAPSRTSNSVRKPRGLAPDLVQYFQEVLDLEWCKALQGFKPFAPPQ